MTDVMGEAFIKWAESQGFKFVDCTVQDQNGTEKIIRTMAGPGKKVGRLKKIKDVQKSNK